MPDGSLPPSRPLRDADSLAEAGLVPAAALPALRAVAARYAVSVTPAMAALIDPTDPADPIAAQYVPDAAELEVAPLELADPIADHAHTPVKGVVHRYPDRALLKPLLACPVYCRFCFRREQVGPSGGVLSEAELEAALDWFAAHPQVREAILTGGDPLMLSPRRLGQILGRLSAMPHIDIIRLHTRVPVADPARVTAKLAEALESEKAVFLCLHANHAREFTDAARLALRHLSRAGVALLGQAVLLRGVNDTAETLEALLRTMLAHRVKPYYLHQLDRAPGTARFEVPIAEGRALLESLRGRVTGLAWPTYALDLPGGQGKAPIGPDFASRAEGGWTVRGPLGGGHFQADAEPPGPAGAG
ncbi:lysine-2,3-aminomutase-like protein [Roseomonas sp. SSH11]|uniref:Lysine-2,3-aminomutase-like protein n=1 Tax=Pararoseomonas baculiformis TaxID=2820812 RepID=A0ABS4AGL9_9PROT|nr:lysine-2,3-aminomutase-like protein [Pararoseomonas baculiformis]MBP0446166.1 lysine-2,3-aminomutase-like protein [Pararoseomonas baculiformis]